MDSSPPWAPLGRARGYRRGTRDTAFPTPPDSRPAAQRPARVGAEHHQLHHRPATARNALDGVSRRRRAAAPLEAGHGNAGGDFWVQEPDGRIDEPGHSSEPVRDNGIASGSGLGVFEVVVDESDRQRPWPFDLRQAEISASGQLPSIPNRFRGGAEVSPLKVIGSLEQAILEALGLECGDRHALAVNGVEAADRVADGQQTVGHRRILSYRRQRVDGIRC